MTEIPESSRVRACPSCATPMRRQSFGRRPMGSVDLDLCFDCQAIWFDAFESPALAPEGVIELFRAIESLQGRTARPLASLMRCVACRERLALTHDIQRTNRIVYYRCPEGHGRLTPFLQFLREKQFVRSLTPAEIDRLKVKVAQVRCSSCGGPVDITKDAACPWCRAPIAILDADAVRKTLAELQQARSAQPASPGADPDAILAAIVAGDRSSARFAGNAAWASQPVDLVHDALSLLTRAL
jgi:ferredoxin